MARREPYLAGEITTSLSLRHIGGLLRSGGLAVEMRESCHYIGGRYIRIAEDDDFTVELAADGEFLVKATTNTVQQLRVAAIQLSQVLTRHDIRHRFELYDEQSNLIDYLHHIWPQVSSM